MTQRDAKTTRMHHALGSALHYLAQGPWWRFRHKERIDAELTEALLRDDAATWWDFTVSIPLADEAEREAFQDLLMTLGERFAEGYGNCIVSSGLFDADREV